MSLPQRIPDLEASPEPREDHVTTLGSIRIRYPPPGQQEASQRRSWLYRFFSSGRSESLVSQWRHQSPPCRSLGYLYIYPTALHVVLLTTPLRAHNDPFLRGLNA
jgi:hypothetical protein